MTEDGARDAHAVLRALFDDWAADRGVLDEVRKPKEHVCFGSDLNLELAGTGFPAKAVLDAGESWRATVESLAASPDLVAALRRTWQS